MLSVALFWLISLSTLSAALRRFMQCNILWRPWSGLDHIVHACTCNCRVSNLWRSKFKIYIPFLPWNLGSTQMQHKYPSYRQHIHNLASATIAVQHHLNWWTYNSVAQNSNHFGSLYADTWPMWKSCRVFADIYTAVEPYLMSCSDWVLCMWCLNPSEWRSSMCTINFTYYNYLFSYRLRLWDMQF